MNIKRVNVVFEFQTDETIMLTIGNQIKDIQKLLNAKIQLVNATKIIPPNLPRIILSFDNTLVNICLNRFEYTIEIPSHISSNVENSMKYVFNKIVELSRFLSVDDRGYSWVGVVVQLEFPSKEKTDTMLEMLTPIFDRLIKFQRNDQDLASFKLQFGLRQNDFYYTYTIGGYETKEFSLEITAINNDINMESNESEIMDYGIAISVDINNKPSPQRITAMKDLENVVFALIDNLTILPEILNLKGVLE